jgi:hypothetical protein
MKQFNIAINGKIKYVGTKKDPSLLYGEYDQDTLMIHFSEDHKTVQVQMEAIKDILKDALKGRTAKQVKQRSKNVVGFSLEDETDVSAVKASAVKVVEILKKEAVRINSELDTGAHPTGNSGTKQPTGNSGSKQPTGAQPGNNGSKQPTGNSGAKQPTGNGGAKQPTGAQPTGNSGAKQPSNNGGSKQSTGNGNTQGNDGKTFDKTKDIYGVPLKQSRPGLFEMCETPEDEDKVYDWYWDMVHRVNTKVVPNPFRNNG